MINDSKINSGFLTFRPPKEIYEAAKGQGVEMPSKLRPMDEKDTINEDINTAGSTENIIVDVGKLAEFIQACAHHTWHDDKKCSEFKPDMNITKRVGLCITLVCLCKSCCTTSEQFALYENGGRWGQRGPTPGNINQGLLLPVVKTKAGASDVSFFLASLNIRQPHISGMYRNINRLCDKVEDINKASLIENQMFVSKVNEIRGESNNITAETDTSYNNRPQAGFEAGTQSFTPLIEQVTNKKLVIEMDVVNKLCPRRYCQHDTKDCKRNYRMEDSIASTESKSTMKNIRSLESSNILKISSITCDGGTQMPCALDTISKELNHKIRQYTCIIHYLRTFQKHIKKIQMTSDVPGDDRSLYMQKLSTSFRMRIYLELSRLGKRNLGEDTFVKNASSSILNVLQCFSNKHQHCKKKSMVCCAHLGKYSPKFLPYNRHLDLNVNDDRAIQNVISSSFSVENLKKISRLLSTNKAESLHHRIYTVAPKSTIWKRNFSLSCWLKQ